MAHLWRMYHNPSSRVLRCRLGRPKASALHLRIFLPLWKWCCVLELEEEYIIALSSTKAEYIAQTHAAKEALWLRAFLREIQGLSTGPLKINCDNQGAIALAKDNKFHARTKHIDIRYHFIREAVEDGKISVKYIPTDDNTADIFTKPLSKPKFRRFVELLGLRSID